MFSENEREFLLELLRKEKLKARNIRANVVVFMPGFHKKARFQTRLINSCIRKLKEN